MMATDERNDRDAADVRRVLAGDPRAFEPIVRRWQGPLVNLAYRFCRDRQRAEDMAQEAFLKAYRSLGSWRAESSFSTWLFAVALSVCRSEMRKFAPPRLEGTIEAMRSEPSWEPEPSDTWRDEAVRRAVARLPAHYRDAVVLFYFRDADAAEAARILGVAEGTLKARLHRGRELLRRKLESMRIAGRTAREART